MNKSSQWSVFEWSVGCSFTYFNTFQKMKNIIKFSTITFLFFFLISCDPIHNIDFINKTDSDIKVKINLNPKVENYYLKNVSTGDSIIFNLNRKDTADIYFGIGTWSDSEINELTNSINNIEIETKDIKTIYKSKKAMINIFENNKHGFLFNTNIEIGIE